MAKKKTMSKDITEDVFTPIDNDLIKKYGKHAFISGDELISDESKIIHVSPKLDLILGGGIPGGSVVVLSGKKKCGKTVSSLHILGKAQQLGRPTYYLDVEGRLKERDVNGIECLDKEKLTVVHSYRDEDTGQSKIFKAHEFLDIAENLAHNKPGAVIVIDSISQLLTAGESEKNLGEQSRAPGAMLMAQFCKRMSNVVPVNDVVIIGIVHLIANTSGYGPALVESGGNKIQYAMDIGLKCQSFKFIRDGGVDSPPVGQEVEWLTTSTAFAPPGQKTTSTITYGVGIDEIGELVDLGIEFGIIQQGGAWFTLSYMEEYDTNYEEKKYKAQGKPKLISRMKENKQERMCLDKAIRSMIG